MFVREGGKLFQGMSLSSTGKIQMEADQYNLALGIASGFCRFQDNMIIRQKLIPCFNL